MGSTKRSSSTTNNIVRKSKLTNDSIMTSARTRAGSNYKEEINSDTNQTLLNYRKEKPNKKEINRKKSHKEQEAAINETLSKVKSVDLDIEDTTFKILAEKILSQSCGKIHVDNLNSIDIILRDFDLDYKYGPCAGMSRLKRWNRAKALNLDPPIIVKTICSTIKGLKESKYRESLWYGQI